MRPRTGALVCILLSLLGLALTAYLGVMHLGLLRGELLGSLGCGSGHGLLNCHAVTGSRWGSVLGAPLWVWGMFGYLAALNLASIGWCFPDWTAKAMALLAGLAAAFVVVDAMLLTIMVTQIRYLCLFCMITYAVNALLLLAAKAAWGGRWSGLMPAAAGAVAQFTPSRQRPLAWLFAGMLGLSGAGSYALHASTQYVSQGDPALVRSRLQEFIRTSPRVSVELSGDPSTGPGGASVTLAEFSDFFCPVCQRASQFNTILLAGHRDTVRLVFKHYPLDTTCNAAVRRMVHPGACTVAAASECAHEQGKFWPFHDLVFTHGHEYELSRLMDDVVGLRMDAQRFQECMDSGRGMAAVRRDVAEGERLGVGSTPTYIVNGVKMSGLLTPAMFDELLGTLRSVEAGR